VQSPTAILHEGLPSKGPKAKYVLRTDVGYTMPQAGNRAPKEANLLNPQVGEALFDLSGNVEEREQQLSQLQGMLRQHKLPRGGPAEAALATLRMNNIDTEELEAWY